MRNILVIFLFVLSGNLAYGQLSAKDKTKLRVKLIKVENAYKASNYSTALNLIQEIEGIIGKGTFEDVQNWKVKSLIGRKRYKEAKTQLDILYGLEPSDKIITDIASYEGRIDSGIKAEKARIERERLAEIERKRKARVAAAKKKRERERKERILKQFRYKQCSDCYGKGYEYEEDKVGCGKGAYVRLIRNGYVQPSKYYQCKRGYLYYDDGTWAVHQLCGGKGKVIKKKVRCSECDGKKKVLHYHGSEKLSYFEKSKYIRENRYTIEKNIREKENKRRAAEYRRQQEIARKKKEREQSFRRRMLRQTLYFDRDWKELSSSYSATYYRPPVKLVNGLYYVKNYYTSNRKLQQEYYASTFAGYKPFYVGVRATYYSSGRISAYSYFDRDSKKKVAIDYRNYEGQNAKIYFYRSNGNTLTSSNNYGKILELEMHSNKVPKMIKWTYIGSKKKYNKYYIYEVDKNGNLKTMKIHNRKWKQKNVINY